MKRAYTVIVNNHASGIYTNSNAEALNKSGIFGEIGEKAYPK